MKCQKVLDTRQDATSPRLERIRSGLLVGQVISVEALEASGDVPSRGVPVRAHVRANQEEVLGT
jgi:hypothetical protein